MQQRHSIGARPAPAGGRPPARILRLDTRRGDAAGLRLLGIVAAATGVPAEKLLHTSRCKADVAVARQLAMYLMNVMLGRSYTAVGRFFGRDRTTVAYACAHVEDRRDEPAYEEFVAAIESDIAALATGQPPTEAANHAAC